jgi:hypothetical protein
MSTGLALNELGRFEDHEGFDGVEIVLSRCAPGIVAVLAVFLVALRKR